jgi:hypothetical protein
MVSHLFVYLSVLFQSNGEVAGREEGKLTTGTGGVEYDKSSLHVCMKTGQENPPNTVCKKRRKRG